MLYKWVKREEQFDWIFKQHSIEEPVTILPNGKVMKHGNTTRKLSTLGESILYKELQRWCAENLSLDIKEPNEVDYKEENRRGKPNEEDFKQEPKQ